jgi:hypothetical protein
MKGEQWEEYAVSKARALAAGLRDLLKELQGTWCGCPAIGVAAGLPSTSGDIIPALGVLMLIVRVSWSWLRGFPQMISPVFGHLMSLKHFRLG